MTFDGKHNDHVCEGSREELLAQIASLTAEVEERDERFEGADCWLIQFAKPGDERDGKYMRHFEYSPAFWRPTEDEATVFQTWHRASFIIGSTGLPARVVRASESGVADDKGHADG